MRIESTVLVVFFMLLQLRSFPQQWRQYVDSGDYFNKIDSFEKQGFYYRNALRLLEGDSFGTLTHAQMAYLYGDFCTMTGKWDTALVSFQVSADIRKALLGASSSLYALSCTRMGDVYRLKYDFKRAEPLLLEARQILETVSKNNADYALSCNNLACLYWFTRDYECATSLFGESIETYRKSGGETIEYVRACSNLANVYCSMGQLKKAEELYRKVQGKYLVLTGRNSADYGFSCFNLGALYFRLAQYDSAAPSLTLAKEILAKAIGSTNPDYAMVCNMLGKVYWYKGSFELAEEMLSLSRHIWSASINQYGRDYAEACNNLGDLYLDKGLYQKAEPLLWEARELRQKLFGRENEDYAQSTSDLGALYYYIRSYDRAEAFLLEAKSIRGHLDDYSDEYAATCNTLGNVYRETKKYDLALPFYKKALQIWGSGRDDYAYNYALINTSIGDLYRLLGRLDTAEIYLLRGRELRQKLLGSANVDYATSVMGLGNLYWAQKNYSKAIASFDVAKSIYRKKLGTGYFDYGLICFNLGLLYWQLNNLSKAYSCFEESFQSQVVQVQNMFEFTSETEKKNYLANTAVFWNGYLSFLARAYPSAKQGLTYNIALFNRNLILNFSKGLRNFLSHSSDTLFQETYAKYIHLKERVSVLASHGGADVAKERLPLDQEIDRVEKALSRQSNQFKKEIEQRNSSWQEIQKVLKRGETAVEFMSFQFFDGVQPGDSVYYVAVIIKPGLKQPLLIPLFEEKQLTGVMKTEVSINHFYRGVEVGMNNAANGSSVFNLVWRPLEKYVSNSHTIYFAPAGLLHKLSFAALPVNRTNILANKYRLVQVSSTASLLRRARTFIKSTDPVQLYGGIIYETDSSTLDLVTPSYTIHKATPVATTSLQRRGEHWAYLPGTRSEVLYIKSLDVHKRVQVKTGWEASEESFKQLNGLKSPAVIHVATHGFFYSQEQQGKDHDQAGDGMSFKRSPDPLLRSGLWMAGAAAAWKGGSTQRGEDGILTSYEVSNMFLPNTKLVVLSACETALGVVQGTEGVYGLQRAFKMAGVENLVMSLWKVPDAETAVFMKTFYSKLFQHQSVAEAFYSTQQLMSKKYRHEPFKWGAWILVR